MDQRQQPRWRKRILWLGGILVALLVVLVLIRIGYTHSWTSFTGFGQHKVKQDVEPTKTLWDWLDLLIVPIVLAIGGYLFTRAENQRTRENADQQRTLDRELADERSQDEALQAYLDGMAQLVTDKEQPLHSAQPGDSLSILGRARTLTVLSRLDRGRKRSVLEFLYESRLIDQEQAFVGESKRIEKRHNIIKLYQADLIEASLGGVNLIGADLSWTVLKEADLSEADLREANLSSAFLNNANLRMARLGAVNLTKTNLSNADLSYANLSEANLRRAVLRGTHLRGAKLTEADLRGVHLTEADLSHANLKGALLRLADLREADLSYADLREADLRWTDLREADLSWANLTGANLLMARLSEANLRNAQGWTDDQLAQARSFEGATMPNGQKYEEWLKDRD